MKNKKILSVIIFSIAATLFLSGCMDDLIDECTTPEDCEGKLTELDCIGEWSCVEGECVWVCVSLPAEGTDFENAVVIEADNEDEGVAMEYDWIDDNACLSAGGALEVGMQTLEEHEGSMYDILDVACFDGSEETYYFNIDSFFVNGE